MRREYMKAILNLVGVVFAALCALSFSIALYVCIPEAGSIVAVIVGIITLTPVAYGIPEAINELRFRRELYLSEKEK